MHTCKKSPCTVPMHTFLGGKEERSSALSSQRVKPPIREQLRSGKGYFLLCLCVSILKLHRHLSRKTSYNHTAFKNSKSECACLFIRRRNLKVLQRRSFYTSSNHLCRSDLWLHKYVLNIYQSYDFIKQLS